MTRTMDKVPATLAITATATLVDDEWWVGAKDAVYTEKKKEKRKVTTFIATENLGQSLHALVQKSGQY